MCRLWNELAQDEGIWLHHVVSCLSSCIFCTSQTSCLQHTRLLHAKRLIFPPDELPHPLVDASALQVRPYLFAYVCRTQLSTQSSARAISSLAASTCTVPRQQSMFALLLRSCVQVTFSFAPQSLAPAATVVRMRQAIEKSEVLQVTRDSHPLWLLKRPTSTSTPHYFRLTYRLHSLDLKLHFP